MSVTAINLAVIKETLARESAGWGRIPKLIAVTKTVQVPDILRLQDLGITDIAENRVQSLLAKYPELAGKFHMHMIGRLQTNKVKYIIDKVMLVQSVDRLSLAEEIDRRSQSSGIVMPVLIQVNIAGETQKAGVTAEDLPKLLYDCACLSGISINGIMAMMPLGADRNQLAVWFSDMRRLFDNIAEESIRNIHMQELSMGMSQDYDLAAQAGATMVRIGTALFRTND